MRITGGSLCGRRLNVPRHGVRPTQDRVREALFSILGESILGCRFLDVFAGSGVVGLEAWSRGADHVHWVERDRRSCAHLRESVEALAGLGREVTCRDAVAFLRQGTATAYDYIFADPPYHAPGDRRKAAGPPGGWSVPLLRAASEGRMLADSGVLILEHHRDEELGDVAGWISAAERVYGQTRLSFLRPG